MISPAEFAVLLERAAVRAKTELVIPTEVLMKLIAEEAKDAVGTYDFGWPQLAAATQADRVRRGYTPNNPLLRSGQLQASIEGDAEATSLGAEGVVGAGDPIAIFHEFGTSKMPPRPIFSEAMIRGEPAATKIYGEFAVEILGFK